MFDVQFDPGGVYQQCAQRPTYDPKIHLYELHSTQCPL